ncbi:hypothetical protein CMQ_2064 [Grosmannia clavigera kw1407]|uniref:Uncharacterized protein n=1 Tax=Grosmannia clavigera (strain kw1407 / UAMH 11150) TaxID=655863 RepID=F0XN30_GROCL|nr:uncharacterized protein CMQ_2064 [Grosmannia clavigera kw1407]EFX00983.1 hypothetical protein CMQ_2064 [Grosmannia clavigera kw1407]
MTTAKNHTSCSRRGDRFAKRHQQSFATGIRDGVFKDTNRRVYAKRAVRAFSGEAKSLSARTNGTFTQAAFECDEITDSAGVSPSWRLHEKLIQYAGMHYEIQYGCEYHSPYAAIVGLSGSGK